MSLKSIRSLPLPADPFLLFLVATVTVAALFPARGVAVVYVDYTVTAAVALLFFLYGARLAPGAVKAGLLHWRLQSMVFAGTFVLFPLLGIGIALLARGHLHADLITGLVFMCLLPSTVQSSIAFTSIARGNVPAALCSASVSNLLGVVLTPLLVSHLTSATSGGLSMAAIQQIAAQLLLPFIVGQLARPLIGAWLGRHSQLTSVVDRGSVLIIVYSAFSAGMVAGIWGQLSVVSLSVLFLINLAVLTVVIVVMTYASRALGFSTEDEVAIVFCGSKKSMATGLPMAAILFPGHALGMTVLPIMLFHQIQLFVCATLARRYATQAGRAAGSTVKLAR
jgi:solute carrier family 10 (sodium/bile acid cotransporter), member 7